MQDIKQQEEMNKRFDDKFGEGRLEEYYSLDDVKSFLQSEILLAVEQEKARISEKIKIYFKGLIVIPNPQATKENLLDLINNK